MLLVAVVAADHHDKTEPEQKIVYTNPFFYSHPMVAPLTYTHVQPQVEVKPVEVKPVEYKKPTHVIKPIVYNTPYNMYAHHYPYMYTQPMVYNAPMVHAQVKTYADDSDSEIDYAAKGNYYAESAGAIHKAKREPEADPLTIYSSYYPQYYHTAPVTTTQVKYTAPVAYKVAAPITTQYKVATPITTQYKVAAPVAYKYAAPLAYNAWAYPQYVY